MWEMKLIQWIFVKNIDITYICEGHEIKKKGNIYIYIYVYVPNNENF